MFKTLKFYKEFFFNKNGWSLSTTLRTKVFFTYSSVAFYDEILMDKNLAVDRPDGPIFLVPIKTTTVSRTILGNSYNIMYISGMFTTLYGNAENILAIIDLANMLEKLNKAMPETVSDPECEETDRETVLFNSCVVNLEPNVLERAVNGLKHAVESGVLEKTSAANREIVHVLNKITESRLTILQADENDLIKIKL